MNKGSVYHNELEGSIYDDFSLYKVINTTKGQPVMLHYDGSVSMITPFDSINCNAFTEDQFEEMFDKMKRVFEGIDSEDITVQFVMCRNKAKVDVEIEHLPSFLQPRAKYLYALAENNRLFENTYYLSVHCQNRSQRQEKEGIISYFVQKFKNRNNALFNLQKAMNGVDPRAAKAMEAMESLRQMLNDIGCRFTLLKDPQEYFNILQKFTRPDRHKLGKVDVDLNDVKDENEKTNSVGTPLRTASQYDKEAPRQILFSGVRADIRKSDFSLDDYYHKIYSLDRSPRKVIYGKTISVLDSLPFEIMYSVIFRKMTHNETLNTFKFKLAEARMISGRNEDAIVEDRTKTQNEQRISDHYDTFAGGDSSGVEISANLCFRIHEKYIERIEQDDKISRQEVLRRFEQQMHKRVFANFGASEWVSEQHTAWKVFCQLIPGMGSCYNLTLKKMVLISQDVPYFLSIYDNKIPGIIHNGTNHFIDMKDNLVPFDLMNPNIPAWNYSISGQTGSGKSVLMNAILTMQLADTAKGQSPVICILDVGGDRGSYAKFMKLVNGTQINLSGAVKPSIQMLQLNAERSIPTEAKKIELSKYFLEEVNKYRKENEPKNGEVREKVNEETMFIRVLNYYQEKLTKGSTELTPSYYKELFFNTFSIPWRQNYQDKLTLKAGECRPDDKRLNMILSLIEIMLSTSGKDIDGFRHFDPDEISHYILQTYERVGQEIVEYDIDKNPVRRYPYMRDLLKVMTEIADHTKTTTRKMLNKIENWTIKGQYSMFDQDTKINMDADIILADMKGVESDPKLQQMYTLLISSLFSDKMYFIKGRRKVMVRDEAWSLMKNARAREFFVEDLRTARKNGFATISISQLPTDYLSPDEAQGRAIMSNMQVNIFCKFDGQAVCSAVGREYNLNDETIDEMTRLGVRRVAQKDGSFKAMYATFMMLIERQIYTFKNVLHPFEYALYSSSAEDNSIIDYYLTVTKKMENLEDVLWYIADNRHIGDQGLISYLEDSGNFNIARAVRGSKK